MIGHMIVSLPRMRGGWRGSIIEISLRLQPLMIPVIRRLANEDKATVFATDSILSTLMCVPRSVHSWDIVIQRVGNKLFFDREIIHDLICSRFMKLLQNHCQRPKRTLTLLIR